MRTRPPLDGDFGFPLGAAAGVVVTIIAVAAGATAHPWLGLSALAIVSAAVAAATSLWASLATAAVYWALHAGFVLGRHGALVFDDRSGRAAVVLAAVTVLTFAVMSTVRNGLPRWPQVDMTSPAAVPRAGGPAISRSSVRRRRRRVASVIAPVSNRRFSSAPSIRGNSRHSSR